MWSCSINFGRIDDVILDPRKNCLQQKKAHAAFIHNRNSLGSTAQEKSFIKLLSIEESLSSRL